MAIRVFALLGRVEILIRRYDIGGACAALGLELLSGPSERSGEVLPPRRAVLLLTHMRATVWASRWWPFGDTCLRRCLVLGALSTDLSPVLVLGTRRSPEGYRAHSWIELRGHEVDISPDTVDPVEWSAFGAP